SAFSPPTASSRPSSVQAPRRATKALMLPLARWKWSVCCAICNPEVHTLMKSPSQKLSPAARRKARRFTVQALYQWQMTGTNIGEIETQFRTDNDMCKTDVAYFHELLHEIPKCVNELDNTFKPLLDRDIKDLDNVE